jgi:hypothetical protein
LRWSRAEADLAGLLGIGDHPGLLQVDRTLEEVAEGLEAGELALQQGLDVRRRGLVTGLVIHVRQRRLHGQSMKAHRDLAAGLPGRGGRLQPLLSDHQGAIAVLAEPQVVGISEVDVKLSPALDFQRLLEDRVRDLIELLDMILERVAVARRLLTTPDQGALDFLDQEADPGDAGGRDLGIAGRRESLAGDGLDRGGQEGRLGGGDDVESVEPEQGHAVDGVGVDREGELPGPLEDLLQAWLVILDAGDLGGDQVGPGPPRGLGVEHLEVATDLGDVGRRGIKLGGGQDIVGVAVGRVEGGQVFRPARLFDGVVLADRLGEHPPPRLNPFRPIILGRRGERGQEEAAQLRLFLGRGHAGPFLVEVGHLLVDRGVPGVDLQGPLVVELGLLVFLGLHLETGPGEDLIDLAGARDRRNTDQADQGDDH